MNVMKIDKGESYMSNKLKKKTKVDWNIHAVLNEDGTTNIHTHGLEKYRLTNLEWICPTQDKDWINWGGAMLNEIALNEVESNEYKCGRGHIIDSADNYDDVRYVFHLEDAIDEYGDSVHLVGCNFYEWVTHPNTGKIFCFDMENKKWERVFTARNYV